MKSNYALALLVALAGTLVLGGPADARRSPAPTTDACGTVLAKADGTTWACTFVDNFDGTSLDRNSWLPHVYFAMGT